MTVKTLKNILASLPDDMEIYVSSDEEGNSYRGLWSAGADAYSDGDGGIIYSEHGWEDNGFDSQDDWDDFVAENKPVLVLA